MITAFVVLILITKAAFWGVILLAVLWANRRFDLRSLPWVVAYIAMVTVLSFGYESAVSPILDRIRQGNLAWSAGDFLGTQTYIHKLAGELAALVLCILVLSDLLHILRNSGAQDQGRNLLRLLTVREHSTVWGAIMAFLLGLPLSVLLTFRVWLP